MGGFGDTKEGSKPRSQERQRARAENDNNGLPAKPNIHVGSQQEESDRQSNAETTSVYAGIEEEDRENTRRTLPCGSFQENRAEQGESRRLLFCAQLEKLLPPKTLR